MAGLVSKLKSKMGQRSLDASESDAAFNYYGDRVDHDSSQRHSTPPRVSLENSAFHVSRGTGQSFDTQANYTDRGKPDSVNQHPRVTNLEDREARTQDVTSERGASRYGPSPELARAHNPRMSLDNQDELTPDRGSSRYAPTATTTTTTTTTFSSKPRGERRSMLNGTATSRFDDKALPTSPSDQWPLSSNERNTPTRSTIRSVPNSNHIPVTEPEVPASPRRDPIARRPLPIPQAPESERTRGTFAEPSTERNERSLHITSNAPTGDARSPNQTLPSIANDSSSWQERTMTELATKEDTSFDHLRLPTSFDLRNTTQTHVTEYQRPAVTHETVVQERTEIVQEQITRDIHVHHYYTYLQPVKVVEVLPPRHYYLDLKSGLKTEVLPPPGWQLPMTMQPVSPDFNVVKGWSRHYLVDEEHPSGVPEAAPEWFAEITNPPQAAA